MAGTQIQLLLADDDQDDCLLFSEALSEVSSTFELEIVHDGVELMNFLANMDVLSLPDLIFLDLNMPRKNGQECLIEIKHDKKFKHIPIFIFSTSFDPKTVSNLKEIGADYYIRKPSDYSSLKTVLKEVLSIIQSENSGKDKKDNFILLS